MHARLHAVGWDATAAAFSRFGRRSLALSSFSAAAAPPPASGACARYARARSSATSSAFACAQEKRTDGSQAGSRQQRLHPQTRPRSLLYSHRNYNASQLHHRLNALLPHRHHHSHHHPSANNLLYPPTPHTLSRSGPSPPVRMFSALAADEGTTHTALQWEDWSNVQPCRPIKARREAADGDEQASDWTPMSWVKGRTDVPFAEDSRLGWWFKAQCKKYGDKELLCIHDKGLRFSWRDLDEESDAFARGLIALGVQKGDRVGVWMQNCAEWVITSLACFKMGAVLVNVNPAYRSHEVSEALAQVGVCTLVINRAFKSSNYVDMLSEIIPQLEHTRPREWSSEELPALRHIIVTDTEGPGSLLNFDAVKKSAEEHPELERALWSMMEKQEPDEPINIQFTSGTTGLPKGATLTHRNILNNGLFNGHAMNLTEHDALCVPVPLYHCFGLVLGNLAAMTHGARLVYPSESFDAARALHAVKQEKCTALHGVPTMFIAMLNHEAFASSDFSRLRTGIMAGSICPIEVMKQVISKMNLSEITIAYGMTETSPVSFQTRPDDAIQKRVETVGLVHPHVECKVVDETGQVVPVETAGELCTKGYSVMRGYWGDQEKTNAVLQDGWMRTGDLVVMDDEGYCRVVGRIKDTIIRGGENIFPREIEDFLLTHPKISDAYAIGVPDKKYGEEICAWCCLRAGESLSEEELKEYCRERIAHYKVPRYVIFDGNVPLTVTGKVQKHVMRERAIDSLRLEDDHFIHKD
eukprot:TRINITY_DN4664_c0_g2_i2.p1 TRINITY_DN4664_c0_g2~~TRINITY_DN4664_c0_g2_i2.p1  ORF type:complete len:815 (-),score=178.77 TRINITY_DN4664_c0_g2_i2:286-2550(-)